MCIARYRSYDFVHNRSVHYAISYALMLSSDSSNADSPPSIIPFPIKVPSLPLRTHPLLTRQTLLPPPQPLRILTPITREITHRRPCLPEILANNPMPAPPRILAVLHQLLETLRPPLRLRFLARFPIRTPGIPRYAIRRAIAVFAAVVQRAETGFPVPAGPAGFLVEALEGFGHAPVDHEAHVFLVDAHTEGGRCDDDVVARGAADPFRLHVCAFQRRETGMVRRGTDVCSAETGG